MLNPTNQQPLQRIHGMSKKKQNIDWEKLCGQLQAALAKEMKENENLDEKLMDAQIEVIQATGIIKYLEKRIADCMDMIDGNEPV